MLMDRRALRAVTFGFLCLPAWGGPPSRHHGDSNRDGGGVDIATVLQTSTHLGAFGGTSMSVSACADNGGGHTARAMFVLMSMCSERGWGLTPVPMDDDGTRYVLTIGASAMAGQEEYQGDQGSVTRPPPQANQQQHRRHIHQCI